MKIVIAYWRIRLAARVLGMTPNQVADMRSLVAFGAAMEALRLTAGRPVSVPKSVGGRADRKGASSGGRR